MTRFQSDTDFAASLDASQRDYFLGRIAEIQHQLQDAYRDLSRGLSAVSALNSDSMTLLSSDDSAGRRILVVGGTEYRFATVPGSGRIKLSSRGGLPIAMWEAGYKNPWVLPFEGFAAFLASGHAKAMHRLLAEADQRRRDAAGRGQ